MTRRLRGLSLVVAIVATVAGLVWLWLTPHRNDLAGFVSLILALVALPSSLIVYRKIFRPQDETGQGRALNTAADRLAAAVEHQWDKEALVRGLLQPPPIEVEWKTPSEPYAGPVWAAAKSPQFPPLPQLAAVGEAELAKGLVTDLHAVYGGLGSGRLVIVGKPGSGKTGAAVLLVLAALKYRRPLKKKDRHLVPVPVLFTLDGWDPSGQPVTDWLAERIKQTYPQFVTKSEAAELVNERKLALILDGLDEIPGELRPVALRNLSDGAHFRIVVLTRREEMKAAVQQDFLTGAAVLELQDVETSAAATYLTSVQVDPAPPAWRELTERLRSVPDSPLAKALSYPLGLTLVRDTYRSRDEVRELLDFCDTPGHDVSREDILDHLLDRVLPAAYDRRPGVKNRSPYDLPTAERALRYIAAQMKLDGTRDLAWWSITRWTPSAPRAIATGLVFALMFALAGGLAGMLAGGLRLGLKFGLGFGLGCGLLCGVGGLWAMVSGLFRGESREWTWPLRWPSLSNSLETQE